MCIRDRYTTRRREVHLFSFVVSDLFDLNGFHELISQTQVIFPQVSIILIILSSLSSSSSALHLYVLGLCYGIDVSPSTQSIPYCFDWDSLFVQSVVTPSLSIQMNAFMTPEIFNIFLTLSFLNLSHRPHLFSLHGNFMES